MAAVREISPYALEALSGHVTGTVHSVFASSFNVELAGRLVHVGAVPALLACTGLSVAASALVDALSCVRVGDLAVARKGTLRLYGRAGVAELDSRKAPTAACCVPVLAGGSWARWAHDRLRSWGLPSGVGLPFDERSASCLDALSAACVSDRELNAAVHHLVGRGSGLTPSGDDVLLGYGTALQMAGERTEALARALKARANATTAVSASYFDAFAHGYVNPIYVELARALDSRNVLSFERAVLQIRGIGHTSGNDALMGLMAGFSRVAAATRAQDSQARCA